jgi:predicted transposase
LSHLAFIQCSVHGEVQPKVLTQTTVLLPLEVSSEESQVLLKTMEAFNRACNLAASTGGASRFKLHKMVYQRIRKEIGLQAQMAIGVIAKTVTAMRQAQHPTFRLRGAIPYD